MTRTCHSKNAAVAAVCSVVLAFCAALVPVDAALAQARTPVQFGLVLKSAFAWPVFVAQHKKFFEQQGLNVEISTTGSAAKTAQQIVAGAIHIGESGQTDFTRAIEKGAPLKIVASEVEKLPYSLIAGKEHRSLADLKGKTILVGGPNDVTRYTAQVILRTAGLNEPAYDFTYSGSSTNRLAAVINGTAAAAILGQPFDFVAVAKGMNKLASAYELIPEFSFAGYAVETGWAEKNRDTLVRLLRADLAGVRWLYDPKNRSEAIDILVKETNASRDDVSNTYEMYLTRLRVYARDGRLTRGGFQKVLEAMVALGDLNQPLPPFEKYVDESFIKAAQ